MSTCLPYFSLKKSKCEKKFEIDIDFVTMVLASAQHWHLVQIQLMDQHCLKKLCA